ncbi:hypothetical protein ACHAWF_005684 [Thalassiosira exigua]
MEPPRSKQDKDEEEKIRPRAERLVAERRKAAAIEAERLKAEKRAERERNAAALEVERLEASSNLVWRVQAVSQGAQNSFTPPNPTPPYALAATQAVAAGGMALIHDSADMAIASINATTAVLCIS